jgi:hypothetical protein
MAPIAIVNRQSGFAFGCAVINLQSTYFFLPLLFFTFLMLFFIPDRQPHVLHIFFLSNQVQNLNQYRLYYFGDTERSMTLLSIINLLCRKDELSFRP